MELMSAREAGQLWGISQRRVNTLCMSGRIDGAVKVDTMWVIPKGTRKPEDARHTRYKKA